MDNTEDEIDEDGRDRKGKLHWNVDLEVSLFHAMHDHKPVG